MRIVRMVKGEIVKEKIIPSKPLVDFGWDYSASKLYRLVYNKLQKAGHFLESGFVSGEKGGPYHYIIMNCGDNCYKVYPNRFNEVEKHERIS